MLRGNGFGDDRGVASSAHANYQQAIDQFAGDVQLAKIFRLMRDVVGVSESEMARRLGTNLTTVLDFEAGAVSALPPWPETVRIVDRYAELAQTDPSPILTRLLTLLPSAGPRQPVPVQPYGGRDTGARPTPNARLYAQQIPGPRYALASSKPATLMTRIETVAAQVSAELPPGFDSRARERETTARTARQQTTTSDTADEVAIAARRRRRTRRTLSVIAPILAGVGLFAAMLMAPRPFYGLARLLPSPIDMPVRGMIDMAVAQSAPVRDGLRWIEMDDPRIRKGDRIGGR